jgi:hypothetical protein
MSLTGAFLKPPSHFAIFTGRRPMTKKKPKLTPEQQKKIRDAIRFSKTKMTMLGEKPVVTLPKLKFLEKKDE